MERKAINKRYQRSNIHEIEINTELFYIVHKRYICTQEKLEKIKKKLRKNLNLISMHKTVMIIGTVFCTW